MTWTLRRPPDPPFIADPRPVCRMCGEEPGGRRRWHPECAAIRDLVWQGRALAHMLKTHGDRCWGCGRTREQREADLDRDYADARARGEVRVMYNRERRVALELEHVRPLWTLTAEERSQMRWWLPFNLQLLCCDCHRKKTTEEARTRIRRDVERDRVARDRERGQERLPLGVLA